MFKELNTLKIFLESPSKKFGVREASRLLKVSPATASKDLGKFAKKGILKESKERGFNLYQANQESDLYRDIKKFYNLRKLKDSGLIPQLNNFYLKPTIILYGSYALGTDTETSDIDLVIISEKKVEFPKLEEFEKILRKKIQIFNVKRLNDLKNKHLINNILGGILIQGEIKWT